MAALGPLRERRQCYPAMLGFKLPGAPLQTSDVDIAQFTNISVAVGDRAPASDRPALRPIVACCPRLLSTQSRPAASVQSVGRVV
ncbi:MAG: GSU2403 family nucleotidyltransferase fold protein [Steroidobacteraceae bacterium]